MAINTSLTGIPAGELYAWDHLNNCLISDNATKSTLEAGELILDGVPLTKTIAAINERLAILDPDMEKLEKFSALKKAYDNYKLIEQMCIEVEDDK